MSGLLDRIACGTSTESDVYRVAAIIRQRDECRKVLKRIAERCDGEAREWAVRALDEIFDEHIE